MAGGGGQSGYVLIANPPGQHFGPAEVEAVGDDNHPVPDIDPRLLQAFGGVGQIKFCQVLWDWGSRMMLSRATPRAAR